MHTLPDRVSDVTILREALTHDVIHRDAGCYSAHPHLGVAADGTWLLVFTQAPRRSVVLHPPLDPAFRNMMMMSHDEGRTWTVPKAVPGDEWTGMECAGLTPLVDGTVLLNQWQFGWVDPEIDPAGNNDLVTPQALARLHAASPEFVGLHADELPGDLLALFPKARSGGRCWVHRTSGPDMPFGQTVEIDTRPYAGGYGMRGGLELGNGEILLPLSDVPHYRTVFTVLSSDGGRTWGEPVTVASDEGCEFEEPAPALLPDGRIFMVLRENVSRVLHSVWSTDNGRTWSVRQPIGIEDYPADLVVLHDGRLAMVAGRRRPQFGIALYLSEDGGETWQAPIAIRDDLPDRDLGYPSLAQRSDGDLFVAYYGRDHDGVTAILSTVVPTSILDNREETHGPG